MAGGLEKTALRSALAFAGGLAGLGLLAGAVRVLPLIADPALPWAVTAPFARSVAWLALEVAIFAGWAIGWSLAVANAVDRGEARVLSTLGRSPLQTATALWPQAIAMAIALGASSFFAARDAREPGRVLSAIIGSGRETCLRVDSPQSLPVPFLDASWLCVPREAPRLFMKPPRPQGATLTATSIDVSADVRDVSLGDVNMAFGAGHLRAGEVRLRRLPPLVASASLLPWARSGAVVSSALLVAFGVTWLILGLHVRRRIVAVGLAGLAVAASFGVLRALDRAGVSSAFLPAVPAAGIIALALGGRTIVWLRHLRATATS